MPRVFQNPDDIHNSIAIAPRIQPCAICGLSMLVSAGSAIDEASGEPICIGCGIDQTVRQLRKG
jgi:hypothetical protein